MKLDGWRGPLATAAMLAVLALTATTFAASVRGRVQMGDGPVAEDDENTFYWKAWNGFVGLASPRPDPQRELAVVLTGSGGGEPAGCNYQLNGGDFLPRTMVVKSGATLRIENRDGCSHELQSDDLPDFAPLATNPGNARPVTVPAGGPYTITDRLYGHVSGTVVPIDDLVACASVNSDGTFTFAEAPEGEYTLKVYRGSEVVHEAPVTVGERELTLDPVRLGSGSGE